MIGECKARFKIGQLTEEEFGELLNVEPISWILEDGILIVEWMYDIDIEVDYDPIWGYTYEEPCYELPKAVRQYVIDYSYETID